MKREITIDDYFPCFPLEKPYFIRNDQGALWPLLIEKALAKSMGGFWKIGNNSIP